jgi:hypothetical protein
MTKLISSAISLIPSDDNVDGRCEAAKGIGVVVKADTKTAGDRNIKIVLRRFIVDDWYKSEKCLLLVVLVLLCGGCDDGRKDFFFVSRSVVSWTSRTEKPCKSHLFSSITLAAVVFFQLRWLTSEKLFHGFASWNGRWTDPKS